MKPVKHFLSGSSSEATGGEKMMEAAERARASSMACGPRNGEGQDRAFAEEDARRRRSESGIPPRFARERLDSHPAEIAEWLEAAKGGDPSNLVVMGPSGAGKTRAAAAAIIAACEETTALFVRSNDLMSELKDAFNGGDSERSVLSKYSRPRILCLDDFGKQRATPYAVESAFNILDNRYCRERPTIVTMQYDAEGLGRKLMKEGADRETAEAIVRRVFDGSTVLSLRR
ncbi:ATP-binding protein [Slackia sp.]|uniref:ATP-binding protein n=1 Tax=Slackia sp. TaxID=2049041 RepID=UPI003A970A2E